MESLDSEPCFMDDLLNFSSDMDEDDEEDRPERAPASSSLEPNGPLGPPDTVRPFHELEEELEWISNKDAFPEVESFVGILSDHQPSAAAASKHHSPVSVLDGSTITVMSATHYSHSNSSSSSGSAATLTSCFSGLKAPRRARSKRRSGRRRGDITGRQLCLSHQASNSKTSNCNANANAKADKPAKKKASPSAAAGAATAATTGRKCQHCGAEKTPQWRAGPYGPKTLCNACGVRYKSGRLVPEYRPASSPSFSSELHSNSHRKILEMRRVKQIMGMVVKHPLESG